MGFGYRANYIVNICSVRLLLLMVALCASHPTQVESVKIVQQQGGEAWLHAMRDKPRQQVQDALVTLKGVGRKVADCVALFSLDKYDVVPVDTHVWQASLHLPLRLTSV